MFGFDIEKYLNRIGLGPDFVDPPMTGETLSLLQNAHLTSVPFENFNILKSIPLNLSTESLYYKIVDNKRGGISTELNGLFGDLLRAMGFGVNEHLGRFLYNDDVSSPKQHRILEVQARDGDYLCDVGFELEGPRVALRLEEGTVQCDGFCEYRLEKEPFLGWVLWQHKEMSEWKKLYSFTDELQLSVDFCQPTFYLEKSPESNFNKFPYAVIRTTDGLITLKKDHFSIYASNQEPRFITSLNDSEYDAKVEEFFGIDRLLEPSRYR